MKFLGRALFIHINLTQQRGDFKMKKFSLLCLFSVFFINLFAESYIKIQNVGTHPIVIYLCQKYPHGGVFGYRSIPENSSIQEMIDPKIQFVSILNIKDVPTKTIFNFGQYGCRKATKTGSFIVSSFNDKNEFDFKCIPPK